MDIVDTNLRDFQYEDFQCNKNMHSIDFSFISFTTRYRLTGSTWAVDLLILKLNKYDIWI